MYILTSSDNNYVQHLGVMLVSLLENCGENKPKEIAVINDGIEKTNIDRLNSTILKYNVPVRYIQFNNTELSHLKPRNNKTLAAFHRLFLDTFYSEEIEKVLYLDCDIIIRKDISELFNTDIQNYVIGAVQNDGLYYQEVLGIPKEKLFFNSGVLLINLKKWRMSGTGQMLLDYINKNFDRMLRNDQDALNAVLYNDWFPLNPAWNTHLYFFTSPHLCRCDQILLKDILADPCVVHFTTQNKPWLYKCEHRFKGEYYKYLKSSAWKDYSIPDKTLANIVKHSLKKTSLSFLTIWKKMKRSVKRLIIKK